MVVQKMAMRVPLGMAIAGSCRREGEREGGRERGRERGREKRKEGGNRE